VKSFTALLLLEPQNAPATFLEHSCALQLPNVVLLQDPRRCNTFCNHITPKTTQNGAQK
jgi:hypothetical protein